MRRLLVTAAALGILFPVLAEAAPDPLSVVQGPVEIQVIRVLDGDTVEFYSHPWPEMSVRGILRVDGVDTPEKRGKCQYEKDLAARAQTFTLNLLAANGNKALLYVIGLEGETGGGFGRYRAQVKIKGQWLTESLIAAGLARENHGEPRSPWC